MFLLKLHAAFFFEEKSKFYEALANLVLLLKLCVDDSSCFRLFVGRNEKFYLGCYVKCLVLKTKTLKFLQKFTRHSCHTTQFLCVSAVVMQFPVILRFFGSKY